MATLDTLDAERRTYAEEISDERRQRVVLQAQLRTARAERAAMEEERDSLREAVLHLIEKGTPCVAQKKQKTRSSRFNSRSMQRLQSLATQRTRVDQSRQYDFFFFGFFLSLPLIRNDRQSNQSRVPSTSSRRRRGPRLHARTQLHCSPHYAKSANASVRRALRPCGASQNSKPSSRGAKRSLRGATRPRQRPPSSHFHVKAPSASCSNLPRVMWR